ncbi:MAG: hypothetical protein OXU69_03280 [Gemmatimonadota bacterium]|nr:hypothetical protein [bacterium]MDE2983706.1 hypothetical protein [Gemmatimonadota bacterium]
MMVNKRTLSCFVVVLAMFMASSIRANAQETGDVTCAWCKEAAIWTDQDHAFPLGGHLCGWSGSGEGNICSRCGGSSSCHIIYVPGPCHILCGPDGDATAALTGIQEALDADDMVALASALLLERTGVDVEFIPEGGRIDLLLPCDLTRPFHSIPVSPAVRGPLEMELSAYLARNGDVVSP